MRYWPGVPFLAVCFAAIPPTSLDDLAAGSLAFDSRCYRWGEVYHNEHAVRKG